MNYEIFGGTLWIDGKLKKLAVLFILFAFVGFIGEFLTGWLLRFLFGRFIWIYPDSVFGTTSIIVIPLWGVAGLIGYGIVKFVESRL